MTEEQKTPPPIDSDPALSEGAAGARAEGQAWWKADWAFLTGLILVVGAIAWGMARYEVVSRAKKAYLEGEKYYSWMQEPAKKKAFFDGELAAKKLTQDQYDLMMQDSDLKNAYVWYETAIELFQPPRSQWVVKAEERMKEVKPKYQAWLKSLGIDPVD
jgi:hypothetical protein